MARNADAVPGDQGADVRLESGEEAAAACPGSGHRTNRTRPGGLLQTALAPQSIRCASRTPSPFAASWRTALIARAPSIGQAKAYWISSFNSTGLGALAWQYAAGGWAFVTVTRTASDPLVGQAHYLSRSTKTRLHLLATGVRLGGTAPLRFPFRLTSGPPGWDVDQARIEHVQAGELTWPAPGELTTLDLSPADESAYLAVVWYRPRMRLNVRQLRLAARLAPGAPGAQRHRIPDRRVGRQALGTAPRQYLNPAVRTGAGAPTALSGYRSSPSQRAVPPPSLEAHC
jgi:hypothetical protein